MGLIRFFDYIYYRLFYFYRKHDKDMDIARTSSSMLIALIQSILFFNFCTILFILFPLKILSGYINKINVIIIVLMFALYNYIRYGYKLEEKIASFTQKWGKEKKEVKIIKAIFLWLFVFALICILMILVTSGKKLY